MFSHGGTAIAHFPFRDGEAAARALAEAGRDILVQYSDHHHRLVLVCDDADRAGHATVAWHAEA